MGQQDEELYSLVLFFFFIQECSNQQNLKLYEIVYTIITKNELALANFCYSEHIDFNTKA